MTNDKRPMANVRAPRDSGMLQFLVRSVLARVLSFPISDWERSERFSRKTSCRSEKGIAQTATLQDSV